MVDFRNLNLCVPSEPVTPSSGTYPQGNNHEYVRAVATRPLRAAPFTKAKQQTTQGTEYYVIIKMIR